MERISPLTAYRQRQKLSTLSAKRFGWKRTSCPIHLRGSIQQKGGRDVLSQTASEGINWKEAAKDKSPERIEPAESRNARAEGRGLRKRTEAGNQASAKWLGIPKS